MKTLIFGLAIGAAVGYLLATEDKEELIEGAKSAANKVKGYWNEGMQKGKRAMSEMKDRISDEVSGV
ncbi:MAG TPA: YtxH domain-containing protein [Chitinophagales bacterium]|nr:YtxH domain-containing protein [Chitinophagales bacterium]